jgi:hypothetical protein
MSLEITGKLLVKYPEQQVSEKFKKREFVLKDDSTQYTQFILLQLTQDKCSLLDNYQIDEPLKVSINIRGREWKSPQGEVKYFNTIEAWRIEKATAQPGQPMPQQAPQQYAPQAPMNPAANFDSAGSVYNAAPDGVDDLPF